MTFAAGRRPRPAQMRSSTHALPNPQFARGLDLLVNAAHGSFDTAPFGARSNATFSSTIAHASGALGRCFRSASGGTEGVYWTLAERPVVAPPVSVMVLVSVTSGDADGAKGFLQLASTSASSGSPDLLIQRNNTDLRVYHNGSYIITESGVMTQNTTHCIVVTADGTTVKLWRNGAMRGSFNTSLTSSTSLKFWLGNGYASSAGCDCYAGAHWTRGLRDSEAELISARPSVLWRRGPSPAAFDAAAAAASVRPVVFACT